jgi:hypothetical protein
MVCKMVCLVSAGLIYAEQNGRNCTGRWLHVQVVLDAFWPEILQLPPIILLGEVTPPIHILGRSQI